MKSQAITFAALVGIATAAAGEPPTEFNLLAASEASTQWQPNPTLWRELTTTRTNVAVPLRGGEYRMRGPLVDALQPAPRAPGERRSLGRRLLSVPVGLLSLALPQPMPQAPTGGGPGYFAWKGESGSPWETISARPATSPGMADSPVTKQANGGLLSIGK